MRLYNIKPLSIQIDEFVIIRSPLNKIDTYSAFDSGYLKIFHLIYLMHLNQT